MIPILKEPEGLGELETCCFCDEPTPMWTDIPELDEGSQVACCSKCAKTYNLKELPTKKDWCERMSLIWDKK